MGSPLPIKISVNIDIEPLDCSYRYIFFINIIIALWPKWLLRFE